MAGSRKEDTRHTSAAAPGSNPGGAMIVPKTDPDELHKSSQERTVRAVAKHAKAARSDPPAAQQKGVRRETVDLQVRIPLILVRLAAALRELDASRGIEAKIAAADIRLAIQLIQELMDASPAGTKDLNDPAGDEPAPEKR